MLGPEKMQKQATHNEALFLPLDQLDRFTKYCLAKTGLKVEQLLTDSGTKCSEAAQRISDSDERSHIKFQAENPGETKPLMVGAGKDVFGRNIHVLVSRSWPGLSTADDVVNYAKRPPFSVPVELQDVPWSVNHKALLGEFMADTTISALFNGNDQTPSLS